MEDKGLKVNIGNNKMMVSSIKNAIALSKIKPRGICGKRVVSNAVCCTPCKKRMHGRCNIMKKVTCSLACYFIYRKCKYLGEGKKEPVEVLRDKIAFYKAHDHWFFIAKHNLFLSTNSSYL